MGVCSNHYWPFNKALHCSPLLAIVNYAIPSVNSQNTELNCQFWQEWNSMTAPPPPPPPVSHPTPIPGFQGLPSLKLLMSSWCLR